MAKSQFTVESDEENKTSDRMADLEIKSNLQLLREQEKIALQSIKKLTEQEMTHIEQWLFTLHKTYEDLEYPSLHRVFQATTYFNDEQQLWYEQTETEINNDWSCFCDRLKQHIHDRQKTQINSPSMNHPLLNINETISSENLIDTKFNKYFGMGDARAWLLQTMDQFKQCGLRRLEQLQAIPFLLDDIAYLWYVENTDLITSFEAFGKLFLQQFSYTSSTIQNNIPIKSTISSPTSSIMGTGTLVTTVPDYSSTLHLQRTIADEIIKKPTYFRGSKDDVMD